MVETDIKTYRYVPARQPVFMFLRNSVKMEFYSYLTSLNIMFYTEMPRFRGILCHGVAKFVDFHSFSWDEGSERMSPTHPNTIFFLVRVPLRDPVCVPVYVCLSVSLMNMSMSSLFFMFMFLFTLMYPPSLSRCLYPLSLSCFLSISPLFSLHLSTPHVGKSSSGSNCHIVTIGPRFWGTNVRF
jgi:hypothetical protein